MSQVRVHILKAFRFSQKADPSQGIHQAEREFNVGDYLLEANDPFLASAWVKAGADGCVELLPQSHTRLRELVATHKNVAAQHTALAKNYQDQLDALPKLPKEKDEKESK